MTTKKAPKPPPPPSTPKSTIMFDVDVANEFREVAKLDNVVYSSLLESCLSLYMAKHHPERRAGLVTPEKRKQIRVAHAPKKS